VAPELNKRGAYDTLSGNMPGIHRVVFNPESHANNFLFEPREFANA
jgi:hypothetical protein